MDPFCRSLPSQVSPHRPFSLLHTHVPSWPCHLSSDNTLFQRWLGYLQPPRVVTTAAAFVASPTPATWRAHCQTIGSLCRLAHAVRAGKKSSSKKSMDSVRTPANVRLHEAIVDTRSGTYAHYPVAAVVHAHQFAHPAVSQVFTIPLSLNSDLADLLHIGNTDPWNNARNASCRTSGYP
ncbi:hypothetical protein BDY19DRAFT_739734 [Irpex rosettiformis]|uniref:Uncharacterized protein n=1 Tax=Irpex rosettiformis TaxID=378272 RepID=A0ACB8U955_9APHY|nr:hypothetical protein BDY19DRAFT_739734 [Irpex rosettiformis]